jgi:hypothetical protein
MSREPQPALPEIDESAWVYLAAHHRDEEVHAAEPFAKLLADTCERFGFAVFPTASAGDESEARAPHWFDAVKHAELCVIDLGAGSAVAGAELAMAYCSGRPVVALRAEDEPLPAGLEAITAQHEAVREVVFADAADCVAKLQDVFADPAWQATVRTSAASDAI